MPDTNIKQNATIPFIDPFISLICESSLIYFLTEDLLIASKRTIQYCQFKACMREND